MRPVTVPVSTLRAERDLRKSREEALRGCEEEIRDLKSQLIRVADLSRDRSLHDRLKLDAIRDLTIAYLDE